MVMYLSLRLTTLSDSVLSITTFEDNIEYSPIGLEIMSTTSIGLLTNFTHLIFHFISFRMSLNNGYVIIHRSKLPAFSL